MARFIDLGVSVFDDAFTLDPFPYLEDLYGAREVLGFCSEGMNFLFRFEQCRHVIRSDRYRRPGPESAGLSLLEERYASLYPDRAWFLQRSYTQGTPNLAFKAALGRFIGTLADSPALVGLDAVLPDVTASQGGGDYIDAIATLPLRIFLDTCQLPYDAGQVQALHAAGQDWLKSFENYHDHALLAQGDRGMATLRAFLSERFDGINPRSPLQPLTAAGRAAGLDDAALIANIAGIFLAGMSNTAGMSSGFMLRTLLHHPPAWRALRDNPALALDERVITELLRRDNHVKALARIAIEPDTIDQFPIAAGEIVYLFFPGINRDPAQWGDPATLALDRDFNSDNNLVFGGAQYTCIGRKLTMAFMRHMLDGFARHLPANARIDDADIGMDGAWVAERIITRLPVELAA